MMIVVVLSVADSSSSASTLLVGWATGRASGLHEFGCWFVGGDDMTGALQDL